MDKISPLKSFEKIKVLADPRRMEILRLLMAGPATLSNLAQILNQSPAWVRHHILALESVDLVELGEVRVTGKVVEKFYRAKASALLMQEMILPKTDMPVLLFSGSHDIALETVAEQLSRHMTLLSLPVGSLDGLVNLRQGLCQVSGAHLLDRSGEYNTPFVRHFFPDRNVKVVTLVHRTQGLILAAGNPKSIKSLTDLAHEDVRFVNRNAGSGTRLWLDTELTRLGIPSDQIKGYENTVSTHIAASTLVSNGTVDAALGLQAAAHQYNLHFLPLFDERYDLILPLEQENSLSPLLEHIQTAVFRQSVDALTGYDTGHSGEQIKIN